MFIIGERCKNIPVLVANGLVTLSTITALGALAAVETRLGAGVRGVGSGDGVGLPDIHLSAARSIATSAGVGISGGRLPVEDVGLSQKSASEISTKLSRFMDSPLR